MPFSDDLKSLWFVHFLNWKGLVYNVLGELPGKVFGSGKCPWMGAKESCLVLKVLNKYNGKVISLEFLEYVQHVLDV